MNSQKASVWETAWSVTDIEVTARDLLDVGVWETAEEEEEEERASMDIAPAAPEPAVATAASADEEIPFISLASG
jgi:hypothetical protein